MASKLETRSTFSETARRIYDEMLRTELEASHMGELISLEPESGEYVLGRTFRDVDLATQQKFGRKPTYIFRIGGGGAVKFGGVSGRERILG